MRNIKIDNRVYICYEQIDKDIVGAEIINNELEYLRGVLNSLDESVHLKNIRYKIVAYEDDEINAFAIKRNGEYILGISIGAFKELLRWFRMIFANIDTYKIFSLGVEQSDFYVELALRLTLEFLALHEYTHIKDGHCDIPENEERVLFEQSRNISKEEALFSQVLEYDADSWAAAECVTRILEGYGNFKEKNEKLKILMLAMYTIFKKFSEYESYDFDNFIDDDLFKYDHPIAWIRYRYVVIIVLNNVKSTSGGKREIWENELAKFIMRFESDVLKITNIKEKVFVGSHTLKGTEHLLLLNNSWGYVADKLKKYAYDELIDLEYITESEAINLSIYDENAKWI